MINNLLILYVITLVVLLAIALKRISNKQEIIKAQERYIEFLEEENKKMIYNPFIELGRALGSAGSAASKMDLKL